MLSDSVDQTLLEKEEQPTNKYVREDPSKWFVHLVAISVQILFGIGNCIGKVALISIPPLIFAFYREFFAGLLLLLICVLNILV